MLAIAVRRVMGTQTQTEFARVIGVDQSVISRLLAFNECTPYVARRIVQAFPELRDEVAAYSAEYFLGKEDSRSEVPLGEVR